MEFITINEFKKLYYFIWDNNDDTINNVNEYLSKVKGENWSCKRCWDEETNSNTSETLCISKKEGNSSINYFYEKGEYVADFGDFFIGFEEEEFNEDIVIKKWEKLNH